MTDVDAQAERIVELNKDIRQLNKNIGSLRTEASKERQAKEIATQRYEKAEHALQAAKRSMDEIGTRLQALKNRTEGLTDQAGLIGKLKRQLQSEKEKTAGIPTMKQEHDALVTRNRALMEQLQDSGAAEKRQIQTNKELQIELEQALAENQRLGAALEAMKIRGQDIAEAAAEEVG